MNEIILRHATTFFELFSDDFSSLLKAHKVAIINKDNKIKIRFRLREILNEIQKIDLPKNRLFSGMDYMTLKRILKSVFHVSSDQAAFYGHTHACYNIDVDMVNAVTGITFNITGDRNENIDSIFQG